MRVLSIRQPWAWLIVNGWKNIENRVWPTRVRGPILIHSAKSMTREEWFAATLFMCGFSWGPDLIQKLPEPENLIDLPRGGIVGSAVILDCVTRHESDWFTGPFGFVLAEQKVLPFRPMKGRLGFFGEVGA